MLYLTKYQNIGNTVFQWTTAKMEDAEFADRIDTRYFLAHIVEENESLPEGGLEQYVKNKFHAQGITVTKITSEPHDSLEFYLIEYRYHDLEKFEIRRAEGIKDCLNHTTINLKDDN